VAHVPQFANHRRGGHTITTGSSCYTSKTTHTVAVTARDAMIDFVTAFTVNVFSFFFLY